MLLIGRRLFYPFGLCDTVSIDAFWHCNTLGAAVLAMWLDKLTSSVLGGHLADKLDFQGQKISRRGITYACVSGKL